MPLLERPEVARRLQVSVATIKRLTAAGRLKCVRIGRRVLYSDEALAEFISSHESPVTHSPEA